MRVRTLNSLPPQIDTLSHVFVMDSVVPLKTLNPLTLTTSRDFIPFSLQHPPSRLRFLPCFARKHLKTRCEFDTRGNGALSGDTDRRFIDRVSFSSFLSSHHFSLKKKRRSCICRCLVPSNTLSIDVLVENPYWVLSQVAVFCHHLVEILYL